MTGFAPEFWHWWVLALLLGTLEVFAPGLVFIWFAIAAAAVGVLLLIDPDIAWQVQLGVFAVLSLGSLLAGRSLAKRWRPAPTDEPALNRGAERHLGRVLVLESPIVNGRGRAVLGDGHWAVSGTDSAAGTRVRVVGVDGAVLLVEPER